MRRGHLTMLSAAAVASAAVALGGCEDESDGLASLVPPDAPLYVEAVVRPGGDQAGAITAITDRVAGISDPGRVIVEGLDESLAAEDLPVNYSEDIEPWLGERAAFFVRSLEPSQLEMPDAALIVETTDPEAAAAFVEDLTAADPEPDEREKTYEGAEYLYDSENDTAAGVVDDFLVMGTEASFKAAVDSSGGESLADSEDFEAGADALSNGRLATARVDLGTALDAAAEADGPEMDAARAALGPLLDEPLSLALGATPETVTLDVATSGDPGIEGETDLLAGLPGEAWFALALTDAGDALRKTLTGLGSLGSELGEPALDPEAVAGLFEARTGLDLERDLLSWLGDVGFFVSGTSEASFRTGAVASSTDTEASTRALEAVNAPSALGLEERDGRIVAALGGDDPVSETVEPESPLGSVSAFEAASEALGDDHAAVAYVALQPFFVVAERGGQASDPDYLAARPYLDAFEYLIAGTGAQDDKRLLRAVVGLAE